MAIPCGVVLVFAVIVWAVLRRWINAAPYGVEIPGVGFVETDRNGQPKYRKDL